MGQITRISFSLLIIFLAFIYSIGKTSTIAIAVFELSLVAIGLFAGYIYSLISLSRKLISIYWSIFTKGMLFKEIRVSISYLFRIAIKDSTGQTQYLLVQNSRMSPIAYQPVGGVYKYFSRGELDKLGAKDAKNFHKKRDYRLRIRADKLGALIKHFDIGLNREVDHSREFYEELVAFPSDILEKDIFPWLNIRKIGRKNSGFRKSVHFKCWEVNFYDIFEVVLSSEQEAYLKTLWDKRDEDDRYKFVPERIIIQQGNDESKNLDVCKVNEHTRHIV